MIWRLNYPGGAVELLESVGGPAPLAGETLDVRLGDVGDDGTLVIRRYVVARREWAFFHRLTGAAEPGDVDPRYPVRGDVELSLWLLAEEE